MNKHDTIELILEHAINQGRYSQLLLDELQAMNEDQLTEVLIRFEDTAV